MPTRGYDRAGRGRCRARCPGARAAGRPL